MPKEPSSPRTRKNPESSLDSKAKKGSVPKTGGRQIRPAVKAAGTSDSLLNRDAQTIAGDGDLRARIARRAYELYERRGGHPGQDLDDWVKAEREVLGHDS